jgi:hypothetical protein
MAESQSPPAGSDGVISSFPRSPSEFDSDPRISFSKLDNKFILETEGGGEYEYLEALKRWVPMVGNHAPQYNTSSQAMFEDTLHDQE